MCLSFLSFFFIISLFLCFFLSFSIRSDVIREISSATNDNHGDWRDLVFCPDDHYVYGFNQKMDCSDLGVNVFEIHCASLDHSQTSIIRSYDNSDGNWQTTQTCGANDFMNSYYVSKSGSGRFWNALSLSDVRMKCISESTYRNAGGGCSSDWTTEISCLSGEAMCGYQIKFETPGFFLDDRRTTDSKFQCCLICKKADGWFVNSGPICSFCHSYCKTCFGSGENQCNSCFNSDTMSGTTCLRADNYYEVATTTDGASFTNLGVTESVSSCMDMTWLGGYGILGSGNSVEIIISGKPPHFKLRIKVRFLKIDSWSGHNGEVYVDGLLQNINELNGISSSSGYLNFGNKCGGSDPEDVINIDYVMSHTKMPFTVKFTSNLDGTSTSKSWGIRNLIVGLYKCSDSCATCSGSASTDCLTCYTNAEKVGGVCICKTTFYAFTLSTCTTDICTICKSCSVGCDSCISDTECTYCSSGYYLYNDAANNLKMCVTDCPSTAPGYWGDTSIKSCVTSCPNTNQYGDVSDHRKCNTCNVNCNTCSGSAVFCTTCSTNYYLSGSVCYTTCPSPGYAIIATNRCEQNCPANQYQHDVDRICYSTCPSTYYANALTGKCTDPCPDGTFPDTATKKCTICHSTCYKCTGSLDTDCSQCYSHASKGSDGKCSCDLTYFLVLVNSCSTPQTCTVCTPCSTGCEICSGSATTECSSCVTNYFLYNSNSCVTDCPSTAPGYWGDTSIKSCVTSCPNTNQYGDVSDHRKCNTCDSNCKTCSGSALVCTTCSTNYYLSGSVCYTTCPSPGYAIIATNRCEQNCPANQYQHDVDRICYSTCPSTYYANTLTGKCTDPCPDGTFPDPATKKCTICHSTCYKCTGPLDTDCSQCYAHASKGIDGKCSCDSTYFLVIVNSCSTPQICTVCTPCSTGCEICSGSTMTECSSCVTNYFLYNSISCVTDCPSTAPGYWGDTSIKSCVTSCPNTNQYGDVSDHRKCNTCDSNCKTCSGSALVCTTCSTNYYLSGSVCYTTCPSPGYAIIATNRCEQNCPANQYQHDVDRICYSTCPSTYYANTLTGKCTDPCPDGTFPDTATKKCTICHSTCYKCTGSLDTDCSQCYSHASKGIDGKCSCDSTYFLVIVNSCSTPQICTVCTPCSTGCEICSGSATTECSSCVTNYFLYNSISCVTDCPSTAPGYWGDTSIKSCVTSCPNINQYGDVSDHRKCNTCDSNCKTCSGSAIVCTSCSGDSYLASSFCQTTCPIPSYAVPATHTCDLQCPSAHFKYDVDRKCYITCPLPSFVNPETEHCVDPCPDGMFKNNAEGKCTLCDFNCQTCSGSASSCLSCKNDWIKSGSSCQPPSNVYQVDSQLDSGFTSHTFLVTNADLLNDHISDCGSFHILGGTNDFGLNAYVTKAYVNVVSHYKIRIRFYFLKIDLWDSKTVSLYLNISPELLVDSKTFTSNQDSSLNLVCGTASTPEALRQFDAYVDHFSSSIDLKIATNLDLGSSIGSWGVYEYKLYVYRCHESCFTCTGQLSNQCETCYPDATKNANKECICNTHFYPVSVTTNTCTAPPCTVCTSCHAECNNCDGGSNTDCIDCSSPRFLLNKQCYTICPIPFFGRLTNNKCEAGCIHHYYPDETDRVCKSCHSDCDNCFGPLNTDCLSCLAPYFLLMKDGLMECVENCGDGFISNEAQRTCLACEVSCNTCNNIAKNSCLTCSLPRYFFDNQCLTSCPPNYYGNNATKHCETDCPQKTFAQKTVNTCWPCSLECKTCIGLSKDDCVECEPNYYFQNTSCVSLCSSGYYEVKNSMKCERCLADCAKCSSSTVCEICSDNKVLLMPENNKCVGCLEEGYYLENNLCYLCASNCKTCEDKARCLECSSGYFQSLGKCLVQERISAKMSVDSTVPNRFYLNFNKKWSNEFQLIKSNLQFNITDISPEDFSYTVNPNPLVENGFIIDLTFKNDVPQDKQLTISFGNVPTKDAFSLEQKVISLPLKEFHICPSGMIYNLQLKSCLNTTIITATLDYTILPNEIELSFDTQFESFWKILPQHSNVTIENLNFTYEFSLLDNDTYLIHFNFNTSFSKKPLCKVHLNIPENLLYEVNSSFTLKENPIVIYLKDYYFLSGQIQDVLQTTKQISTNMNTVASSTTMTNNFMSFGSSFAITAMMSMEVIRFLKFLEIDYPPNVDDMFASGSPVPGIIPNVEMEIDGQETTVLPIIFGKNQVSIYLFNNNGNVLIENFTYFLFAWFIMGINNLINKTKILYAKKIINFIHAIFVWNFVISYYLGVFMNYIFFDLIFLRFPATSSALGKFNYALAIFEIILILGSLLFISLKIKQMHDRSSPTPSNKVTPAKQSQETDNNFIQTDTPLKTSRPDNLSEFKPNHSIFSPRTALSTSELSPLFQKGSPQQAEAEKRYPNNDDKSIRKENENNNQQESLTLSPVEVFNKVQTLKNSSPIADFNSPKIQKMKSFAPRRWSQIGELFKVSFDDRQNSTNLERTDKNDSRPKSDHLDNDFKLWGSDKVAPGGSNSPFSCLYDDLEHANLGQSYFLMFDVLRQILVAIMIVLFYDLPIVALSVINFVNFEILILLIFIRPLKNRIDLIHTSTNELCINVACWSSFALALMQVLELGDTDMRMNIGWIIIGANGVIMLAVVLRLTFLVVETSILMMNLAHKYFKDRKELKAKRTKIHAENDNKINKEEDELKIEEI